MFITQLTKYDWYRIYKYLWKEQLVPASKIRRTIIKICAVSQRLLSLYVILGSIPYMITDPYFAISCIAIVILFCIILYPLLFCIRLTKFSPKLLITLKQSMSGPQVKQVYKDYPTAYIPKYGLFSPPSNCKWTALIFNDCYLLCLNFHQPYDQKRYFTLFSVIKATDIANTDRFHTQLESVCERIIDNSNIRLLHKK